MVILQHPHGVFVGTNNYSSLWTGSLNYASCFDGSLHPLLMVFSDGKLILVLR